MTFIPTTGFVGSVTFPYTIIDENNQTDQAVSIVDIVNDTPVALNDIVSTIVNTPVTITPLTNDSDPNHDPLTITQINGIPIII